MTKCQTTLNKTHHNQRKTEQHEPNIKPGVISGAPEG